MRILTWNVNGLRAREKQGFVKAIQQMDPDIICLQEVRATINQLNKETRKLLDSFKGWSLNKSVKAGYAGVLTASKFKIDNTDMMGETEGNGRFIDALINSLHIINVYSPNSGRSLEKLGVRLLWEKSLKDYILNRTTDNFIICGDMNVAPESKDCNVFSKCGTSKEERAAFQELLAATNSVDMLAELHPYGQHFTWFSNQYDSRAVNKGMRIDHFIVSKTIGSRISSIEIIHDPQLICGSDHNPVILTIE